MIKWIYVMFYEEYNLTPSAHPIKNLEHLPRLSEPGWFSFIKIDFLKYSPALRLDKTEKECSHKG